MSNPDVLDKHRIGEIYDQQAGQYDSFSQERFAWDYIEKPAYGQIRDLITPTTRILVIGCGSGTEIAYLQALGASAENIIGIDPSVGQLAHARQHNPGVTFLHTSAENFALPSESVDLVITNTVIHHLDNEQFVQMLDLTYDVLSPNGTYFFVEVDPDHNEVGRNPSFDGLMTLVHTPWGTEVPFFNRHPATLLNLLDQYGFDFVSGGPLPVIVPAGAKVDASELERYSNRPSRMAGRYRRVDEMRRILRRHNVRAPSLMESAEQEIMSELMRQYFLAWQTQSIELIEQIFMSDAIYDEKPGKVEPITGLEAIKNYWRENPLSQENLSLSAHMLGHSGEDSIWSNFQASFDVRGHHVEITGIIQFTINSEERKIARLKEYFTTKKTTL